MLIYHLKLIKLSQARTCNLISVMNIMDINHFPDT